MQRFGLSSKLLADSKIDKFLKKQKEPSHFEMVPFLWSLKLIHNRIGSREPFFKRKQS